MHALVTFNSGHGVVAINLLQVQGAVVDVSQGVPGNAFAHALAKGTQEVLIHDSGGPAPPIPPRAITVIQFPFKK